MPAAASLEIGGIVCPALRPNLYGHAPQVAEPVSIAAGDSLGVLPAILKSLSVLEIVSIAVGDSLGVLPFWIRVSRGY